MALRLLLGLAATLVLGALFAPLGGLVLILTLIGAAAAARPRVGGTQTVRGGWFGPCPHCEAETVLRDGRGSADQPFACHACGGAVLFRARRFVAPPQAVSRATTRQTASTD